MLSKRITITLMTVLALVVGLGLGFALHLPDSAQAQEVDPAQLQAAIGSAFTYQGRLTDDQGDPLTGPYDFEFRLYDSSGGGSQIGSAVTVDDLQVDDGRFTVSLDFGANAFTSDPRWLAIGVRDGGSGGAFTPLSPRQALTPAPYALYAGGLDWSDLDNVPGDVVDGDDDTTYSAGDGLSLSGTVFSVDFAGSGSASTVARSDHDHLGQTWVGNDNPLYLTGAFDADSDTPAPLMIENSVDAGIYISSTGTTGVAVGVAGRNGVGVGSATEDGLSVLSAGGHGVYVGSAASDGVHIGEAGTPPSTKISTGKSGFEVAGAEGNGVYVGHAGSNGVSVFSAADDGVFVNTAGRDGVRVTQVGTPRLISSSILNNGFVVDGAEGHGLWVGHANNNGIVIDGADRHGILVRNADRDSTGDGVAGRFEGDVEITGNLSKGSGSFTIDHPLDPENKTLSHSFVESPDMMNVYNGNVTTDDEGYATVTLPDYFEGLNRDYRYQLTVIGTFAQAIIAEEIEGNQFVIQTDEPNVKVSWQVTGIRDDPYAQENPIEVEAEKPEDEQGLYLHPEAYDQPASKGTDGTQEGAE